MTLLSDPESGTTAADPGQLQASRPRSAETPQSYPRLIEPAVKRLAERWVPYYNALRRPLTGSEHRRTYPSHERISGFSGFLSDVLLQLDCIPVIANQASAILPGGE